MKFGLEGLSNIGRVIAISSLIILNAIIGLYVYANITDWKIPLINPSDKAYEMPLTLAYPPASGPMLIVNPDTIWIEIMLNYTGVIAERQPVTIDAYGTLSPELAQNIQSVSIGFEGALPYSETGSIIPFSPPYGGVALSPNSTASGHFPVSFGAFLTGEQATINWQVQGDYYPTLVIHYINFNYTIQNYPDFRVHVSSTDVVQQGRYGKLNTVLSIAVFLFAFVESIAVITRLLPKKG